MTPLLQAEHISKTYTLSQPLGRGGAKVLRAVDDVTLAVGRGEIIGIVGESGCGKSTLGRCLLRVTEPSAGSIRFEGVDMLAIGSAEMRRWRQRMQMVFQDPYSSLNPRRRVFDLIAEPLRVHRKSNGERRSRQEIKTRIDELIDLVGLSPEHLTRFPHEFSGGQRQRIGIARALALGPDLLVADECVSALDVSIQAQIVNLLLDLQERLGIACIFISHDLSVVRLISSRTMVMYLGSVVEQGPTDTLFARPSHPYTRALLSAVPTLSIGGPPQERILLQGDLPSPVNPPSGCRFRTRCPKAAARCATERPVLSDHADGKQVACHFPD